MLFHIIEKEHAVLYRRGMYRQCELYWRSNNGFKELFAKWGAGFIRLHAERGTSVPDVSWDYISIKTAVGQHARLVAPEVRLAA